MSMSGLAGLMRAALVSGGAAAVGSTAALVGAARLEGVAVLRPVNASSHWLRGPGAGAVARLDGAHTGVGFATNAAACVFWAALFEGWRAWRGRRGGAGVLRDAAAMSVVAAVVDYRATPRRFTPGWELALSRRGMAVAYGGLALGLAAGSLLVQGARRGR